MQLIHSKSTEAKSVADAVKLSDGVVGIAILIDIGNEDNAVLAVKIIFC